VFKIALTTGVIFFLLSLNHFILRNNARVLVRQLLSVANNPALIWTPQNYTLRANVLLWRKHNQSYSNG